MLPAQGDRLFQRTGVQDERVPLAPAGRGLHGGLDFRCGRADEHQRLDLLHNRGAERRERDFLVVPARDEQDLAVEKRERAADGAAGRGADGVVVIAHAVHLAHELVAVRHAGEAARDAHNLLRAGEAPHGADGGEVIFHIVQAGDADVPRVHHAAGAPVGPGEADFAVRVHPRAEGDGVPAAEGQALPAHAVRKRGRDFVVGVEHRAPERVLVQHDVLLRVDILPHGAVHVQVVGRKVRDHGRVRAAPHGDELEARKLRGDQVARLHLPRAGQQGRADVAAQVHRVPRRLQNLRDEGRGGGLAVAAGHAEDSARAHVEEDLHLGGDRRPAGARGVQLRQKVAHPRRAENHVLIHAVEVPFARHEADAQRLQLLPGRAELLFGAPVAPRDPRARAGQQLRQRQVAAAQPAERDLLPAHRAVKFFGCHRCAPLLPVLPISVIIDCAGRNSKAFGAKRPPPGRRAQRVQALTRLKKPAARPMGMGLA